MTAAVVYYWVALFHGQRWMPPVLSIGLVAGLLLCSPIDQSAAATMLALSFPVTMWLVYSTYRVEDVGQEEVTVSSLGSIGKVVVARALAASALVLPIPFAVIAIGFGASGLTLPIALVATGHLVLVTAAGAGIGSLVGARAQQHPGWAMQVMLLVALLAVVVPHAPPVRSALEALHSESSPVGAVQLGQAGTSTVLAISTLWLATRLSRRGA